MGGDGTGGPLSLNSMSSKKSEGSNAIKGILSVLYRSDNRSGATVVPQTLPRTSDGQMFTRRTTVASEPNAETTLNKIHIDDATFNTRLATVKNKWHSR